MRLKAVFLPAAAAAAVFLAAGAFAQTDDADYAALKAAYEKLKADYDNLLKDRDNLRSQAQHLLQYKDEIIKAQQQAEQIDAERKKWEIDKQIFANQNDRLKRHIEVLEAKIDELEVTAGQLQEERDEIRKSLSKTKAGYIIVEDLKAKIKEKEKETLRLNRRSKRMERKMNKLEDQTAKAETTAEILRRQVREAREKYARAVRQNKILEKKLERQPKQYAEIARENKLLIRRTALMHYNLGVFYTKNKEYERAIAEFEKAIELNPADVYAFFNLGYIYAEYYVDRPKAIQYFKKYLELAKKDDKDTDWVKKYILTWQTWEGGSVMK